MKLEKRAKKLLKEFKGSSYSFGPGALAQIGGIAKSLGKKAVLIRDSFPGSDPFVSTIVDSLKRAGITVAGEVPGAGPNCPLEDLRRIAEDVRGLAPEVVISFGGGSTIDAGKAAEVLRTLGGEIDDYFGTALVTGKLEETGKSLSPHIAVQTVASSAAHLTKYSNITNVETGQKKLIVDDAIVPARPMFDYSVTYGAPPALTSDGGMDGIAHSLEVFYGATGKADYERVKLIAATGIELVVRHLPTVVANPQDKDARDGLCLATDLGGYSIMVGGTNGGHLTSFSLVDVLSHGRSCAIMNPYYTVLFAPAIEDALRTVGGIYRDAGYSSADMESLKGRDLGVAVAEAMFAFAEKIGFPTKLGGVPGFGKEHIDRALAAAKNPQLAMKLQNMPIPLDASMIDEYMGPVLEAAAEGDLSRIKNVS